MSLVGFYEIILSTNSLFKNSNLQNVNIDGKSMSYGVKSLKASIYGPSLEWA